MIFPLMVNQFPKILNKLGAFSFECANRVSIIEASLAFVAAVMRGQGILYPQWSLWTDRNPPYLELHPVPQIVDDSNEPSRSSTFCSVRFCSCLPFFIR